MLLYLLELGADAMYTTSRRQYGDGGLDAPSSPLQRRRTSSTGFSTDSEGQTQGTNTPLHWACYKGHVDTVSLLLQAGYNLEDRDPVGNQCLHLASSGSHHEVVELLLAHSAPADTKNQYGNRPVDLATTSECRRFLTRFEAQSSCQWCKEEFGRVRRPSLCQRCHNIYCDTKPCSSTTTTPLAVTTDIATARSTSDGQTEANVTQPSSGQFTLTRTMRYCQECATEMRKAEQDLRNVLEAKQTLIQQTLDLIAGPRPSTNARARSRPGTTTTTALETPPTDIEGGDARAVESDAEASSEPSTLEDGTVVENSNGDATEPDDFQSSVLSDPPSSEPIDYIDPAPPSSIDAAGPQQPRVLTGDAILRVLTLDQTDAEALYTALEAARAKAADSALQETARRTYHQLVAHVALQDEIKALLVARPIGIRSLLEPLKLSLQHAAREQVDPVMLTLARQVIRSAEAECTLFGAHALCDKIAVGSTKHRRDIARLDASLREARELGASDKLLTTASTLYARLTTEILLEQVLTPFAPVAMVHPDTNAEVTRYSFRDGSVVDTLLQALELRTSQVSAAVVTNGLMKVNTLMVVADGHFDRKRQGPSKAWRQRCSTSATHCSSSSRRRSERRPRTRRSVGDSRRRRRSRRPRRARRKRRNKQKHMCARDSQGGPVWILVPSWPVPCIKSTEAEPAA